MGREAFLEGTRLKVWQIVDIYRAYGEDLARTATHLNENSKRIEAALQYAADYPDEIEAALAANNLDYADLKGKLPTLRLVEFDAASP